MQVQFDHISRSEGVLWQVGEEEFVDDAFPHDANRVLLLGGRVGGDHDAAWHALGSYRDLRTIVECAGCLALRALLELIRWQVQTGLDKWVIEGGVLLATGHKGEACEISEHSSRAILAVEPEQRPLRWELIRREISCDRSQALAQFHTILPVAAVSKTAEPVITVRLANDCARAIS